MTLHLSSLCWPELLLFVTSLGASLPDLNLLLSTCEKPEVPWREMETVLPSWFQHSRNKTCISSKSNHSPLPLLDGETSQISEQAFESHRTGDFLIKATWFLKCCSWILPHYFVRTKTFSLHTPPREDVTQKLLYLNLYLLGAALSWLQVNRNSIKALWETSSEFY